MISRYQAEKQVHQMLLRDIQALLQEFEVVWLDFCYREANKVANLFATLEKCNMLVYQTCDNNPPNFALEALLNALSGRVEPLLLGELCNPIIKLI